MTGKKYGNGTMTEAQYLSWIRSALRSRWLRWLPRAEALKQAQVPYVGENTRRKYSYRCAICSELFSQKDCEVDHHPHDAGSIRSLDDIGPFVGRLFCEIDNLRVLCKKCHSVYTYAQKQGINFEQALVEKKVIETLKDKKKTLDLCTKMGYNTSTLTNEAKRRAALQEIFSKGET